MYLREALKRCATLHERVARLYSRIAELAAEAGSAAGHWRHLADESQAAARMLTALIQLAPDDGPFLTELPRKIATAARRIESIASGLDEAPASSSAPELGDALEQLRLSAVTSELVAACRSWGRASARLLEVAAAACEALSTSVA